MLHLINNVMKMSIREFSIILAHKDPDVKIEIKKCFLASPAPYVAYVINGQVIPLNAKVMYDETNFPSYPIIVY